MENLEGLVLLSDEQLTDLKDNGTLTAKDNTNTEVTVEYKNGILYAVPEDPKELLNKIYPIGSIYMSVKNVSPESFLGGKWEPIQDTFLLAAGTSYAAGTSGGTATTSHYHWQSVGADLGLSGGDTIYFNRNDAVDTRVLENVQKTMIHNGATQGVGTVRQDSTSAATLDNMPPYLTVYMWQRTA